MNFAIILSGGVGMRMGHSSLPKQYVDVYGKPVVMYTLEKFEASPSIDRIIVVASSEWKEQILEWVDKFHITKFACIADGGDSRQESAYSGLLACKQYAPTESDKVLIHDAARPMITPEKIEAIIEKLDHCDSCFLAVPMKDSIVISTNGKSLTGWADRSELFHGQTPEGFHLLQYLRVNEVTDRQEMKKIHGCNELAYRLGWNIQLVPGDDMNFKITTSTDMDRFFFIQASANQ